MSGADGIGYWPLSSRYRGIKESTSMSPDHESDMADQEIPDRQTADAAKWLSEQNAGFDTPTFWLVAGLLGNYSQQCRESAFRNLASAMKKVYPKAVEMIRNVDAEHQKAYAEFVAFLRK